MEDQKTLTDALAQSDDKTANAGGRPGAQAKGGIAPQPDDPETARDRASSRHPGTTATPDK